jgi:hypothetical protein
MQERSRSPEYGFLTGHARKPDPALKLLDLLVGTWNMIGFEFESDTEIKGYASFEWMEGGFFLVQHVNLEYKGQKIRAIEVIGYDESTMTLKSHCFDNMGNVFEHVWELENDSLTIRSEDIRSPVIFTGKFSDSDNLISGAWKWPGGGYTVTMTRAGTR